ncbi:MAG: PQQ-binding-like beta-propeller repeat protein [Actinomycetota bacterium]
MRARVAFLAMVALVAAAPVGVARAGVPPCATAAHPGGEWRSYGGGLSNSRNQPNETVINASTVANLTPAVSFRASVAQTGGGAFSNTPVVADGCVYLASNTGWVFALNADTLELRWKTKLQGAGQTLLGGVIVGSPVVAGGVVFLGVSRPTTPYVAALDQADGRVLWTTKVEDGQLNALINASPVYFDGMIFQGFAGNEGGSVARGGFAILDASHDCSETSATTCAEPVLGATGGMLLKHTYTISDAEYGAGYRGASVWCTAAVDPAAKYAYACGGNPASKRLEARYSNSLLKIDMDRTHTATFGMIVDSYKGETDQYYPGLDRQPACDMFGEDIVYVAWSVTCVQLDLDFGASPNLFRDSLGNLVVGDLQKSGVYHAVFADHMQRAWTAVLGSPCFACNVSSAAYDDERVYVAGSPGAVMWGLDRDRGRYRWAFPLPDATHFQSVSTANGVVYTMDDSGTLTAFDAALGVPVAKRLIGIDAGANTLAVDASSQGVAIARNTVYALSGEFLVAYR